MRRCAAPVRVAPVRARVPHVPSRTALLRSTPQKRLFSASSYRRSQEASVHKAESPSSPPPPPHHHHHTPPPPTTDPSAASATTPPPITEPQVILRHQVPAYRFIHTTIMGQLGVAYLLCPVILSEETLLANPTAPWLAFGLPVLATFQWAVWRWFLRHWVVEVRALPNYEYEWDTLGRAFARVKTTKITQADIASREHITLYTTLLRISKNKEYFLLNRHKAKLAIYNEDAVNEMLDPLLDQLAIEDAAKAEAIEAESRAKIEAEAKTLAKGYRPFSRPKSEDQLPPKS